MEELDWGDENLLLIIENNGIRMDEMIYLLENYDALNGCTLVLLEMNWDKRVSRSVSVSLIGGQKS